MLTGLFSNPYAKKSRTFWFWPHKFKGQIAYKQTKTLFILLCLLSIPTVTLLSYVIYQNYSIFLEYSFINAPELLDHLHRERIWTISIIFITLISFVLIVSVYTLISFHKILAPINVIENHMYKILNGHLDSSPIMVRRNDELKFFVKTYNNLIEHFYEQTLEDIELLEKMTQKPHLQDSRKELLELLGKKRGLFNESASTALQSHDSHLAS